MVNNCNSSSASGQRDATDKVTGQDSHYNAIWFGSMWCNGGTYARRAYPARHWSIRCWTCSCAGMLDGMPVVNNHPTSTMLMGSASTPPWPVNILDGMPVVNNVDGISFHIRVWHSWKFWYEWMYEYIRINKITRMNIRIYSYSFFDTNECPNNYLYWKLHEYSNIFEYSSWLYTLTHSPTTVSYTHLTLPTIYSV